MAFEIGNTLGQGNRKKMLVTEHIQRAIVQDDAKRLRQGIEIVLDQAATGDLQALTYIRDTIQGKPAQAVTVSGDDDAPIVSLIKMVVVNANQFNELATLQGREEKEISTVESIPEAPTPPPLVGHIPDGG